MFGRTDDRPPLDRALDAAAGLRPGAWESVETLAMLAIEARGRSESVMLLDQATRASLSLKAGSWDSIRALTWLARARRELA